MRRWVALGFVLTLISIDASGCAPQVDRDVLFQASTITALVEGLYDGNVTLAALQKHGDIGLGTFEGLDGELVLVDGCVYQVRADGRVHRPGPEAKTPFAAVTFFDADRALGADGPFDLADLESLLDKAAPARNLPVAVRITGRLKYVKTRSVPRQEKPYPRLADVTAKQPTFEFRDLEGTLVGFRIPECAKGLNVPGWHLHFLTADRTGGGHVLALETESVRIEMDETPTILVALPQDEAFRQADLSKDPSAEIGRAEK